MNECNFSTPNIYNSTINKCDDVIQMWKLHLINNQITHLILIGWFINIFTKIYNIQGTRTMITKIEIDKHCEFVIIVQPR